MGRARVWRPFAGRRTPLPEDAGKGSEVGGAASASRSPEKDYAETARDSGWTSSSSTETTLETPRSSMVTP